MGIVASYGSQYRGDVSYVRTRIRLRLEPDIDHGAPEAAVLQLKQECRAHEGKTWEFWDELNKLNQWA